MLWRKREQALSKDASSPTPEHHFTRPAPRPQTALGDFERMRCGNHALVQARADLLKKRALAYTRARFSRLMSSNVPRGVWGVRARRAKACSRACEGASFLQTCPRLHQSTIFASHELDFATSLGASSLGQISRLSCVFLACSVLVTWLDFTFVKLNYPLIFNAFQGAAAAAAGRGSPPPPTGRRGGCGW